MNLYLDTSGLVKLLLDEEGSDHMEQLWNDAGYLWASLLGYAEARAALAAAARERCLTADELQGRRSTLDEYWGDVDVIAVSEDIVRSAGDYSEMFALRGYDSVHLSTALTVKEESLIFVTWDRELSNGASAAGLRVFPEGN